MFRERMTIRIHLFGFFLTFVAGFVNAASYLGIYHQAVSHVTGNVTKFAYVLVQGEIPQVLSVGMVLFAFFLGSVLSGIVIGGPEFVLGRRYGVMMILESLFLFLGAYLLYHFAALAGELSISLACGIQNSMVSTFSGAIIRTTHMTGIVTDLGILTGRLITGRKVELWKGVLFSLLLAGFLLGGMLGSLFYGFISFHALLVPASLTMAMGVLYMIYRLHRERRK